MELNIIADVAGQYDALLRLTAKMPKSAPFLGVGDLVDRGPESRKVVEWFIKNGDSLYGNHEDMMIDFLLNKGHYSPYIWVANGGASTLNNYDFIETKDIHLIPVNHIHWITSRRPFLELDNLIVTHAPLPSDSKDLLGLYQNAPLNFIWNRNEPFKRDKFQIFGHNSHWGLKWFAEQDQTPWAVCIDQSRKEVLTGIHWPSLEIFEEPYLDSKAPSI